MLFRRVGVLGGLLLGSSYVNLDDQLYVSQSSESKIKIFSGSSHRVLASEIAGSLGIQLGRAAITKYPDGETKIRVLDDVSGRDVYIIQSCTSPVNESLIELLFMISCLRTAHCRKVTAVIPYLAYAQQDVLNDTRHALLAADITELIQAIGADLIITIDLHSPYIKGFFKIPLVNLTANSLGANYFSRKDLRRPVVVSANASGFLIAAQFRYQLLNLGVDCDIGVLPSQKNSKDSDSIFNHHEGILSEDMQNRDVIIVSDVLKTGRHCLNAVQELRKLDVGKVYLFASHGIFTSNAIEKINNSSVSELVLTNTLPLKQDTIKIRQVSVAKLLAEAIYRTYHEHEYVGMVSG